MKIVFATNNENKVKEISSILPASWEIVSLKTIGLFEDIPETQDTLEGNALQKVRFVKEKTGIDCFADDTGLEVKALNNEPGVYSARYAGNDRNDDRNIEKVLNKLENANDRSARFRTVIALILNGEEHQFEGIVEGRIVNEKRGSNGFGYDPIFEPENTGMTFAEMTMSEKNDCSHRARAFDKMASYLSEK
jgi:XTP/dITP diphosphohydrolase